MFKMREVHYNQMRKFLKLKNKQTNKQTQALNQR